MCVVPTLSFDLLFAFLVLGHGRRQLLWFEVTRNPTADWLARQITEAFPWTSAPGYLVRDNDRAYGHVFTFRVGAMGIRDRPISPGSPWQNGIAERLIGTLRRECLDQMVHLRGGALRRVLSAYAAYYNQVRTHLALQKDAPFHRTAQRSGTIVATDLGRAASPIRPDMIFGKDNQPRKVNRSPLVRGNVYRRRWNIPPSRHTRAGQKFFHEDGIARERPVRLRGECPPPRRTSLPQG